MEHTDGLHSAMSELKKHKKWLMMKTHHIICSEYLQLKVIYHNHSTKGCQSNLFLFEASHCLCRERYYFIKKCYDNAYTIKHITNPENTVSFYNLENHKLKCILQNKHDHCSCYVANSQLMQCKHMINFKKKSIYLLLENAGTKEIK